MRRLIISGKYYAQHNGSLQAGRVSFRPRLLRGRIRRVRTGGPACCRCFKTGLLMNKKLIASLVCAASLGAAFSADALIAENQLTIWVNSDKGYNGIAKVGERYTKKTGVKVTVAHPDQVEVKFQQTSSSGPMTASASGQSLLSPITPSAEEKEKFAAFTWDAMTIGGKIYGYPVSVEAIGLLCNKKLVPEVPENWEDFVKLDDQLKKQGARAVIWDYNTPYFSYPLISANGGFAFKKGADGFYNVDETGVGNEGARAGMKYLVDMIKNDHIEKGADYGVMEAKFSKGQVGCIVNCPWAWSNYDQAKVDFSVNRLPKLNGQWSRPFVGVLGFVLNAASPNKDLAVDFLENYLLTDEGLKDMNDDKALGAAAIKTFQAQVGKNPRVATTIENAQNGDLMPSVPEMSRFWSSFQTALKNATSGRQSVDEALDTAAKRVVQK